MARNETFYIYGTYENDLTVLDATAVEALEYSAWDWATAETVNHIWRGTYSAFDGDDHITRDRPGSYRADISPNGNVNAAGDAFLYGGSGSDQVSYAMATGAVHIDLGAAPGYGTAEAIGLHGVTIHGGDRLHSFENASGSNHDDIVEGSGIANRLFGLDGDDEMMGHGGHDSLRGGNGNDSADGGSGNDTLMGDDGSDVLRGGDNSDTVQGGNHNDTLSGNAGNDSFVGGVNSDTIHGDDGFDTAIWEGSGRVVITETASGRITAHQDGYTDTIWGVEAVVTGGGNDDVRLRGGSDLIDLGDGTDFARGGGGNDSILGGTGNDTAYGDGGNDALSGSNGEDWLAGGDGNDTIDGGNHDDTVRGDDGHDVLSGAGGGDVLYGGAGKDTATGGSGEDRFVFWGNGGFDTLADFALGTDLIDVNALVHDAAWNDGTYANDVQAAAIQGGTSTLLYANTDDGWVAFALLSGVGNSAAVQAAIADNSLFFGEMLNDGGPGGVIF